MDRFFVNDIAQPSGEHEVHKEGCSDMPSMLNRTDLGMHSNCISAVRKAKEKYANVDGCFYCSNACHTR